MGAYSLWIPIAIATGATIIASHIPGPVASAILAPYQMEGQTAAHLLLYTFLGITVARYLKIVYGIRGGGLLFLAGAVCVSYGVIDEWHQTFVVERTAEFGDLFLDGIGGVGGSLAYAMGSWALHDTREPVIGMHSWRVGWRACAARLGVAGLALAVVSAAGYGLVNRISPELSRLAGATEQPVPSHRFIISSDGPRNALPMNEPPHLSSPAVDANGRLWSMSAGASDAPRIGPLAGPVDGHDATAQERTLPVATPAMTKLPMSGSPDGHIPWFVVRYRNDLPPQSLSTPLSGGHPVVIRASKGNRFADPADPLVLEGFGGFVLAHADNPVAELSTQAVGKIFSGAVSNWRHLGGPDMPIRLLIGGRGSAEMFRNQLKTSVAVDARRVPFAGLAIAMVDQSRGAVCFVRVEHERNLRIVEKSRSLKRIKIVASSGPDVVVIAPVHGSPWVTSGELFVPYPLWQPASKDIAVNAVLSGATQNELMPPFGYGWSQRFP